tara:strand:- start:3590 stop:4726 length:1137 start_codon:yes stop_codon:yes gene_type:complete
MKRRLGNGRWDRVLMANMVELSVADNYEEAREEWLATGKCWWSSSGEQMPNWVLRHPNKCLCGHDIIYHFEILNTENGIRECVGSDHINSYLIIRALKQSGLAEEQITDEKIEEWINIRMKEMKSNAWWEMHGAEFQRMFDEIKDFDLRVNVRTKGKYYDSKLRMNRDKTFIRKRQSGNFGEAGYQMASIVWRWNHPDNPKPQVQTRGYPNQQLHQDVMMFYFNLGNAKKIIAKEDKFIERRIETLENFDKQQKQKIADSIKKRETLVEKLKEQSDEPKFIEACNYYGVPPFIPEEMGFDDWSVSFLKDIRFRMIKDRELSEKQVAKLWDILDKGGKPPMATQKQKDYLQRLGYEGDLDELTKSQAGTEITKLRNNKW